MEPPDFDDYRLVESTRRANLSCNYLWISSSLVLPEPTSDEPDFYSVDNFRAWGRFGFLNDSLVFHLVHRCGSCTVPALAAMLLEVCCSQRWRVVSIAIPCGPILGPAQ